MTPAFVTEHFCPVNGLQFGASLAKRLVPHDVRESTPSQCELLSCRENSSHSLWALPACRGACREEATHIARNITEIQHEV